MPNFLPLVDRPALLANPRRFCRKLIPLKQAIFYHKDNKWYVNLPKIDNIVFEFCVTSVVGPNDGVQLYGR